SPDGRLTAVSLSNRTSVAILENASGSLVGEFNGHHERILSVAFASDGRTLATGGQDGVTFVWDTGFSNQTNPMKRSRTTANLWVELASADAARAWAAIHALEQVPEAVPFLRDRVKPVRAAPPEQVARLIESLSAPAFSDRERAERDLAALTDAARPELEQ